MEAIYIVTGINDHDKTDKANVSHRSETHPAGVREGEGAIVLGGQLGDVDVLVQGFERGEELQLSDTHDKERTRVNKQQYVQIN